MDRFAPLFVLFLIYLFFGMAGSSKNKKNKQKQRPAAQAPRKPAPRPQPARQPSAEKKKAAVKAPEPPTADPAPHRGADGTLHPTERHLHASSAPSLLTMEGNLAEGTDPCHEYMLDDPVLPECEDLAPSMPDETPSLPLSFTRDSMVNAVVMSEILNRKSRRPGIR